MRNSCRRRCENFAYEDSPLPIAEGQTISQPYIVDFMADALLLKGGEQVLEIGTGSGYAAAVLAEIAANVYSVERIGQLAEKAAVRLTELGYDNVHVLHADGTKGWPEHAPYDAIVVAAGGPKIPKSLQRQLKVGGRLVIPVFLQPKQNYFKIRSLCLMPSPGKRCWDGFRKKPNEKLYAERIYEALADGEIGDMTAKNCGCLKRHTLDTAKKTLHYREAVTLCALLEVGDKQPATLHPVLREYENLLEAKRTGRGLNVGSREFPYAAIEDLLGTKDKGANAQWQTGVAPAFETPFAYGSERKSASEPRGARAQGSRR